MNFNSPIDGRAEFERHEILQDMRFARPHLVREVLLHGGFGDDGSYISPRAFGRWRAVNAWNLALARKSGSLIDVSNSILPEPSYPNLNQLEFLHQHNFDRTFWNWITSTGLIERRAVSLCGMSAPDFGPILVEGVSDSCLGHLNKGLLWAHGADEGGDPGDRSRGGHDRAWFAVRDLAFPDFSAPLDQLPRDSRGNTPSRDMPGIPLPHELFLKFMMGVLVVEVRAEAFFTLCINFFSNPKNLKSRREEAELAAELVGRIRQDEGIHVAYLQTALSEARHFTFRTAGGPVRGASLIDPVWNRIRGVIRAGRRKAIAEDVRLEMVSELGPARGLELFDEFDSLERPAPSAC